MMKRFMRYETFLFFTELLQKSPLLILVKGLTKPKGLGNTNFLKERRRQDNKNKSVFSPSMSTHALVGINI